MTFPNSSSSTAVPYRSTARMASGDAWLGDTPAAWMTPVMSPSAVDGLDERVDRLARGHVDGGCADLEAGVAQHLGRGVGVALAQVGQHDVLAGADPPGDGLANRAGSNDDDDFVHDHFSSALWTGYGTGVPHSGHLDRLSHHLRGPAKGVLTRHPCGAAGGYVDWSATQSREHARQRTGPDMQITHSSIDTAKARPTGSPVTCTSTYRRPGRQLDVRGRHRALPPARAPRGTPTRTVRQSTSPRALGCASARAVPSR